MVRGGAVGERVNDLDAEIKAAEADGCTAVADARRPRLNVLVDELRGVRNDIKDIRDAMANTRYP